MTWFCFKCPECDHRHEVSQLHTNEYCPNCQDFMVRDWKAENANFTRVPDGGRRHK